MTGAGPQPPLAARPPVMTLFVVVAGADAFGDAAAMVTLMLRLYRAGNPAWAITALLFAILGPSALLAPFAARVLVRWGVWRTLVMTSAGQAVAAAALIFARGTWPTLFLVVLLGLGLAMTQPAFLSVTPTLVGPDRLTWANSLTRTANWVGWTIGPLTGGALCAAGLAGAALGIEATSFMLAGVCYGVLGRALPASAGPVHVTTAPADGAQLAMTGALRYILRDRGLARLIAAVGITNLCVFMIGVAEVFFARDVLRTGSLGFATLGSAWYGGMIAGTLAAPRADAWRPSLTASAGIGLTGAAIVAAASASYLPAAAVAFAIAGVGFGLQVTVMRSMIQRRAAGPLCGAVCGIWVAVEMSTQLAGYLAGGAAMLAGARVTLTIAGSGLCLASCATVAMADRDGPAPREVHHEQAEGPARRDAVEGARVTVASARPAAQRVQRAGSAGP
jgi:hypothetical protein